MQESDRTPPTNEQIIAKIQEFRRTYVSPREIILGWGFAYFDNFHAHIALPPDQPGFRYRDMYKDTWDVTYASRLEKSKDELLKVGYSSRLLDETPHIFYDNFDRTIREEGLDPDMIGRLSVERGDIFYNSIIPVYASLIEQGYSHYDLTT